MAEGEQNARGIWGSVEGALHAIRSPQSVNCNDDADIQQPILQSNGRQVDSRHGWSRLLVAATASSVLSTVFPAGYHIGNLNGPQQVMMEFCNASVLHVYGVSLDDSALQLLWSFVVSIFLIGAGIGAFFAGTLANRIGRRNALYVNGLLNVVGAVIFGFCQLASSVEMLLVGRLIVGLAGGMSTSLMPLYISEIATESTKNVLGIMCPVGITFGLFVGQLLSLENVLGTAELWNILLAISCAPVAVSMLVWPFLPESPHFLAVVRQRSDAGIKELCRLRGATEAELHEEIEKMRREAAAQAKSPDTKKRDEDDDADWGFRRIWKSRSLRPLFICCIVMHAGNQLSGINAVFYYSTGIFESAGLNKEQAEFTLLGSGLVNFVMCCSSMYFTNRYPRRPLMFVSTGGIVVFLIVLTVAIRFIKYAQWVAYTSIVALMLFIVFFELGVGPLPFHLPSELIPPGPRPFVMSVGCMTNWMANFAVGMTFPSVQNLLGVYSFVIFIVGTALQAAYLYFCLPETHKRVVRRHSDIVE